MKPRICLIMSLAAKSLLAYDSSNYTVNALGEDDSRISEFLDTKTKELHGYGSLTVTAKDWKSFTQSIDLELKAAMTSDGMEVSNGAAVVVNSGPYFCELIGTDSKREVKLLVHVFPKPEGQCYISYHQTTTNTGQPNPSAPPAPDNAAR